MGGVGAVLYSDKLLFFACWNEFAASCNCLHPLHRFCKEAAAIKLFFLNLQMPIFITTISTDTIDIIITFTIIAIIITSEEEMRQWSPSGVCPVWQGWHLEAIWQPMSFSASLSLYSSSSSSAAAARIRCPFQASSLATLVLYTLPLWLGQSVTRSVVVSD